MTACPASRFPATPTNYPTRDEVVSYLTEYAKHFQLPVEYDSPVRAARPEQDGRLVELDDRTYRADQVVVATGPFQTPRVPPIAEGLSPDVVQMHSADYRSPLAIPAGSVLVVGGGNTGFQIAEELSGSHDAHLSVGSRQLPLPQRILGRDIFGFLVATGLMAMTRESRMGRRMRDRDSLIGSSPRRARRRGIQLHARACAATGTSVAFEDGASVEVATIIWATGFRLDHSWVDAPVCFADGAVLHERGVTPCPGLYFLGLPWQHTRGSALLGWVKDDAEYLAQQIAGRRAHSAQRLPATTA